MLCLGRALADQGRRPVATACLRRSLVCDPAIAEAHYCLAKLQDAGERHLAAPVGFPRALAAAPGCAALVSNIAIALHQRGQSWKAERCWRQAVALDPTLAEAYHNLGSINREHGRGEAALLCFGRSASLAAESPEAPISEAMSRLMLGDYAEGWRQYRHCRRDGGSARRFTQPEWTGENIAGRTILLHAEQGYGDTLQFCRYAPLVAARARVLLEVQAPLLRLLAGMPGVARVVARGRPLPPFDLHCPLMNLPALFGTTLESIPRTGPYLCAEPGRVAHWRTLLGGAQPQIGLCWAGSPAHPRDAERSLPLARLRPLLRTGGIAWHSLQKEPRPGEAGILSAIPGFADHQLSDFADTAALIAVLDLVITVDTAIAHLAGALGRPTWLLLPFAGDWRWLSGREDSPWYPGMRIFRQPSPGDWGAVVDRLAHHLVRTIGRGGIEDGHRTVYDLCKRRA